jgi:hypothetical protein
MSRIGSYKNTAFNESQKFLVLDPSTSSASLVLASELVAYITPKIGSVLAETTRLSAENTDYKVGEMVQTSGATAIADGLASVYLVVAGGDGDFPMINGNDLLVIVGDDALRAQLISQTAGQGASLVSMEGGPTVEAAVTAAEADILNRVIRVSSRTEMKSYDVPAGYQFSLEEGGRSGLFVVKVGAAPTDTQEGFYIVLTNGNYVERVNKYPVTPEMFGALFDGSNDAAAWNGMASVMDSGSIVTSSTPGGTSTCSAGVLFSKSVNFDMPDIKVVVTGGDFNITGAIATLTATLSADINKSEMSLTVSDGSQFAEGDEIIIQNADNFSFSLHRAEYQDGEFFTVSSVTTNTVFLTTGLLSSYLSAGNIQFYKVTPVYASMKGIKFSGLATNNLLQLDLVKDFYIESVDVKGGTNRALSLRRCYGGELIGGVFDHKEPASGTNYGISIANCQDLELRPTRAFGTRHGIATGGFAGAGAVPCRNVYIRKAAIASTDSHAADIHGNAENVFYVDCNIYGGTGIGGKNCGVRGGTVASRNADIRAPLQWTEIVGGVLEFDGIQVGMAANSAGNLCAPNSSIANQDISENLIIKATHLVVDVPASNTSVGPFSFTITQNGTLSTSMYIDDIQFTGDVSAFTRIFSGSLNNDAAWGTAPQPFTEFYMENIKLNTSSLDFWFINGGTFTAGTLVTAPKLSFSSVLTLANGGYVSPAVSFTYPGYTIAPQVFVEYDGATIAGGTFVMPLVTGVTAIQATALLTTMHTSETVTVAVIARVSVRVGLDKFLWT